MTTIPTQATTASLPAEGTKLQSTEPARTITDRQFESTSDTETSDRESLENCILFNFSTDSNDGDIEEELTLENRRPNSRSTGQQTGPDDFNLDFDLGQLSFNSVRVASIPNESLQEPVAQNNNKKIEKRKKDWKLELGDKDHLIIADSNLVISEPNKISNIQINCFAEATFRNILNVLEKNDTCPNIQTVILSIGIHNRKQQLLTATKEVQRLYKLVTKKFPNATILFPIINFSPNLPETERNLLKDLNKFLKTKYRTIQPLAAQHLETDNGDIQWSIKTTAMILDYWRKHLNF